ncbi:MULTISPECIES: hypothetical protein [unclassified Plantibacter]|jgi:hypothetical protein|uniref:hypothetical protein n=1 Tax=unclassified Plantibacter TaxID=2624265 RepID=UPI003D332B12
MSNATAALDFDLLPDRHPRRRQDVRKPDIRAVAAGVRSRTKPKPLYAVVVVVAVIGIVSAQLLVSVSLSQGAYEITQLQGQQKELGRTTSTLTEDLNRLSSPQYLAENAQALGMVGNTVPSYLRLSDGAILGVPTPAEASTSPIFDASLVPNSQTAGLPLVSADKPAGTDPANASVPPAGGEQGPVALQDGLPSPTTR